jgi:hypothetical protein
MSVDLQGHVKHGVGYLCNMTIVLVNEVSILWLWLWLWLWCQASLESQPCELKVRYQSFVQSVHTFYAIMGFKVQPFFRYEPLDHSHDSFRLCRLLSGVGDTPIHCELTHETISAQTDCYNALSYTWGSATEQRWIRLNGKPYHVQPSLMHALNAIRRRDEAVTIWIDAICINQGVTSERNHQVAMMGDIYRNAKCVLAWLGPAADDSDAYFDYLESLGTAEGDEKKRIEEAGKRAVVLLNKRPYWRRAWIKQELILAKDITIYCGSRSNAAESFFLFASLLTFDEIYGYDDYISMIDLHRTTKGERKTLKQLLHRYANSECSNRLDRVFALLSMASDCIGMESRLVDYSLTPSMLFFALIAHFEPSNVLSFATILQDVLDVRRAELLEYMSSVSEDITRKPSSPMEKLAIDYIHRVKDYMVSIASGISVSHTEFITQSYNAILPSKLPHEHIVFRIKGTNFVLGFIPSLFGLHFRAVFKKREHVEAGEADGSWEIYNPPFRFEQVWRYVVLPILVLDKNGPHLMDPDLIAPVKDAVVGNHGPDAVKPSIDIICYTLAELGRRDKFKNGKLCLVDCRYVVSTLYGYSLMRPLGFKDPSDK